MSHTLKFLANFTLAYFSLSVMAAGLAFGLARGGLLDAIPQDIAIIWLCLSWTAALYVATSDGFTKGRMARGTLSPEKAASYQQYILAIAAHRRKMAIGATAVGLLFHLVVEGLTILRAGDGATLSLLNPRSILAQAALLYLLSLLILPQLRGGGGGGRRRWTMRSKLTLARPELRAGALDAAR